MTDLRSIYAHMRIEGGTVMHDVCTTVAENIGEFYLTSNEYSAIVDARIELAKENSMLAFGDAYTDSTQYIYRGKLFPEFGQNPRTLHYSLKAKADELDARLFSVDNFDDQLDALFIATLSQSNNNPLSLFYMTPVELHEVVYNAICFYGYTVCLKEDVHYIPKLLPSILSESTKFNLDYLKKSHKLTLKRLEKYLMLNLLGV